MMVAERPQWVQVGPYLYRVHWDRAQMDHARVEEGETDLNGRVRYRTAEVWVDPDMAPSYQRVVLLHEVLHAILELSGAVDYSMATTDDDVLRRIDAGLVDLLRRNPLLAAWLTAPDVDDDANDGG